MGASGEDWLEQVKTETAEPVFMCDDNLSDISFDCVVQKGLKSFSLEVDAWSNVLNKDVAWESRREEFNLSVEISWLSPCGDPGIAEVKFRYLILDLRGSKGKDSRFRVPILARRRFDGGDFSLMCPFEEGVFVDVEDTTDLSGGEELVIHKEILFY